MGSTQRETDSLVAPVRLHSRDDKRIFKEPLDSKNGSFTFPRAFPLTFKEGSMINISWTTTNQNVNLYFYQRGKADKPVQLAANLAERWFQWEVFTSQRYLDEPFVFRADNAAGSIEEMKTGGFWSASYYITRNGTETATRTHTLLPPTTRAKISEPTTTPSSTPVNQTEATEPSGGTKTSMSSGAIAGVSVGISIVAIVLVAIVMIYLRRRRQKRDEVSPTAELPLEPPSPLPVEKWSSSQEPQELYTQPYEIRDGDSPTELPAETPSPSPQNTR